MPQIPELLELLKAGVHFGHKTSRWHPKMAPFIFGERSGVHIINIEKTQEQLQAALQFVKNLGKEGKILVFVGTKKQAAAIMAEQAKVAGLPYVQGRWLGGMLTNWIELSKTIRHYVELKTQRDRGELLKYTKKEQGEFAKQIERLRRVFEGLENLTKLPDALFIVDLKHEVTAVREATQKKIPIVALCDTNVNPETVTYPIVGNDDAVKAIALITQLIAEAYQEGVAERSAVQATETETAPKSEV